MDMFHRAPTYCWFVSPVWVTNASRCEGIVLSDRLACPAHPNDTAEFLAAAFFQTAIDDRFSSGLSLLPH